MDRFNRDDLRTLQANRQTPCVSLLMPTTRGVGNEDKIRWKNLIGQAEDRLTASGWRLSEAKQLLTPALDLLNDAPFWLNASEGLAVFVSPERTHSYRVPIEVQERTVIGEHFHVKPLLPMLSGDGRFFVLALSQKNVRLLEATRHTVEKVELEGVPRNADEAHLYEDVQISRTVHTFPSAGGKAGTRQGVVHGKGVGVDSAKDGLLSYFQRVDRGLHRYLHDEQAPLVVAAVDYLLPIYQEANTYPHLVDKAVKGHPDRMSDQELRDRAWEVVQPRFQQEREQLAALYGQLAATTGRTSKDVSEILPAAYAGQIQYLFVDPQWEQWGTFEPNSQSVTTHEQAESGDEDLVNLAAIHALSHKGTVYTVKPDELPDRSSLAAIFWLPLGERRDKTIIGSSVR